MLQQKMAQKMVHKLSPQQIQLIKLLQVPTALLDQRIQEELESNPALEVAEAGQEEQQEDLYPSTEENYSTEGDNAELSKDDFSTEDYIQEYIEDDPGSYQMRLEESNIDEENKSMPIKVEMTFHDYLLQQLGMLDIKDERKVKIAEQIIGSIDEDGYLRREPDAIVDDLVFSMGISATEKEVNDILNRIRQFDPPGVASMDLKECLLRQLEEKRKNHEASNAALENAYHLLDKYFDAFSKKHYDKLKRQLNLTDETLREAIQEILKLNPKPASGFLKSNSSSSSMYIIPDFIIHNRDGELELTLNNKNAPELRINNKYKNILNNFNDKKKNGSNSKKDQEAVMFVKTKIDSAKWFIDAIKQRQQTLYRTMYAILQSQKEFFLTGDESKIKPMILKDIAELTGLDISTISRVANSKYVQTEFGTKLLKDFFSESVTKEDGEEVSTLEVKKELTNIIANEDKSKPLSDEKLKEALLKKGYNIARRTIAKYRESLNIPVARLRREL